MLRQAKSPKVEALISDTTSIFKYLGRPSSSRDIAHITLDFSVLHYKSNTENILLDDIKRIFENNIQKLAFPDIDINKKVIDLIFEAADECLSAEEGINLENKIVLSIAIRLKAEQFMKAKITDERFLKGLGNVKNQTYRLLKKDAIKSVIVVLGGGVVRGSPVGDAEIGKSSLKRLYEGYRIHKQTGFDVCVSGGKVFGHKGDSEAEVMRDVLIDWGGLRKTVLLLRYVRTTRGRMRSIPVLF